MQMAALAFFSRGWVGGGIPFISPPPSYTLSKLLPAHQSTDCNPFTQLYSQLAPKQQSWGKQCKPDTTSELKSEGSQDHRKLQETCRAKTCLGALILINQTFQNYSKQKENQRTWIQQEGNKDDSSTDKPTGS